MEIIAVISTLLSVYLAIKVNIWNWPVGIIGILAYMILFYQQKLYAEFLLQFLFVGQSIYGWYYWNKTKHEDVVFLDLRKFLEHMVGIFFISVFTYLILPKYTNGVIMCLDIITAWLSILAMWYMSRKVINHWLVWMIANVFFIYMFILIQMYWSAGLYFILLCLNINGLISWVKNMKTA